MTLAIFDIFALVLIVVIAVRASLSGFVSEFFSKAAVLIASATAVLLYKRIVPNIVEITGNALFPEIISFLLIFIVVYLLVKVLQQFIGSFFQSESLANLDHALGFFFGIAEGLVLVAVIMSVLRIQPWLDVSPLIRDSIFVKLLSPLTGYGADYLSGFVPQILK
ncbi:MAG TPA: CvpA family protein [Treponemataceae bacterium]|jgi:membrane protein required for colicin V production|nr:CvpA family protein [Treponemataceae bacterium]HPX46886.1 CvpA family protein [Treponemataceae bacterium]HQL32537.1 CvpA family protein [Treponemataceae bacterium]